MLTLLAPQPTDRVLDIGTGSGYHAALLATLSEHVWSIERHRQLSEAAAGALATLNIDNVTLLVGDGSAGLPAHAPFNAINVAAATDRLRTLALEEQLADGGRLVVPIGRRQQYLIRSHRTTEGIQRQRLDPVRFVPLIAE
jgi:protein-L-isoaspartate(D-aspartate) O-methyltransferase